MARVSKLEAVAVLDVGRTNVRLLAVGPGGDILSSRRAPNAAHQGEPYPHCDTEHIWRWMKAALADLGERFTVQAIVPISYGATAALVAEDALVLPIMDYDAEPPAAIADAYAEVAPWFEECCCPILPAGATLARQLFWQSRAFPEDFGRARWILPFAQYWAWGLCGVPASEVTSLGAQTQLWNPRERDLSELAKHEGWDAILPPLRNAWDVLGPLQLEIAEQCELPTDTPVLCGIHALGARYARCLAAGLDDFTLISRGKWLVAWNTALPLADLDPLRNTVSNVDLLGRPVACARFMAGREYALIAGDDNRADADITDIEALIAAGTVALPGFADSGGPYPESAGRGLIAGPMPETARARSALASLYVALTTNAMLDLLRSKNPVVLEGGRAEDVLLARLLAALRPDQRVAFTREADGAALGAALLWGWQARAPVQLGLATIEAPEIAGLATYAERWRAWATPVGAL